MSGASIWRFRILVDLADETGRGDRTGRYRGYGKLEVMAQGRREAGQLGLAAAIAAWNSAFPAPAEPARITRITMVDPCPSYLSPGPSGAAVVSLSLTPYRLIWLPGTGRS